MPSVMDIITEISPSPQSLFSDWDKKIMRIIPEFLVQSKTNWLAEEKLTESTLKTDLPSKIFLISLLPSHLTNIRHYPVNSCSAPRNV